MATKKVKKFGRGGDILTGLGAGLAGYGIYKALTKGKDKDDDYTRRVKEYGIKGKFPEEKSEEKATSKKDEPVAEDKVEAKTDSGRNSNLSPVEQHAAITKRSGSGGSSDNTPVDSNVKKPRKDNKPSNQSQSQSQNSAYDGKGMSGSDKGAPTLKPGESKVVGEGDLKPYPANLPAVKEAERRKYLQTRAGMKRTGIATPGTDKDRKERSKGRSANPIQETIDNAGKSMARTPQQKMAEGAREVERRRQKEKAEKLGYGIKKGGMVKKYASGGSVKRSASSRADGIAIRGKTRA